MQMYVLFDTMNIIWKKKKEILGIFHTFFKQKTTKFILLIPLILKRQWKIKKIIINIVF